VRAAARATCGVRLEPIEEGNEQDEIAGHALGEGGDALTCDARSELDEAQARR
jgi:hypothetical protein